MRPGKYAPKHNFKVLQRMNFEFFGCTLGFCKVFWLYIVFCIGFMTVLAGLRCSYCACLQRSFSICRGMQYVIGTVQWSKEAKKQGSKEARKEGRKQGSKEARKEGRKQGRKEGRKEARKQGSKEARKQDSKQASKQGNKETSKVNTQVSLFEAGATFGNRCCFMDTGTHPKKVERDCSAASILI